MTITGLIDIPFGSEDFQSTLEDEFTIAKIQKELEGVTDIEQLRKGAVMLLNLAVMRQSMIRGLIRRLGTLESTAMLSALPK